MIRIGHFVITRDHGLMSQLRTSEVEIGKFWDDLSYDVKDRIKAGQLLVSLKLAIADLNKQRPL